VEDLVGEPDGLISGSLDRLWNSFEELANNPAGLGVRNIAVQELRNTTESISRVGRGFKELRGRINDDVVRLVGEVNRLTAEVADVNGQIINRRGTEAPNSLLDKRDAILDSLAELVGSTTTFEGDRATIRIGGVQAVGVTGARLLEVDSATNTLSIGGQVLSAGGELGAKNWFANDELLEFHGDFDRWALEVAAALNAIHTIGWVDSTAAGDLLVNFNANDAGATIGINMTGPRRWGVSDTPGPPFPAASGLGAQRLADLRTANRGLGFSATLGDALKIFALGLANDTAEAARVHEVQEEVTMALDLQRSSEIGVQLDEEMIDLITYQRAYQAPGRVVTATDELLDTLINRTGVVGR
jgi:flagellar hook-associated protein 1 FlgK